MSTTATHSFLKFAACCNECGSDLEFFGDPTMGDPDGDRNPVLVLNVKPCPNCLENAEGVGEDNHQREEDALWDSRRDR